MTIDEAIKRHKFAKCQSLNWKKDFGTFYTVEEHEQLAEWLEELKVFKELYPDTNIKSSLKTNYNNGWNDAIDNFKDRLLANEVVDKSVVKRVATQLKETL